MLDHVGDRIDGLDGTVARLARGLVDRSRELTAEINELTAEITARVTRLTPSLIAIPGCGAITAAKILGETAGVDRFCGQGRLRPPRRHCTNASLVIEQRHGTD